MCVIKGQKNGSYWRLELWELCDFELSIWCWDILYYCYWPSTRIIEPLFGFLLLHQVSTESDYLLSEMNVQLLRIESIIKTQVPST